MAYGLKYTLPWKDIDNNSNIVEIYQDLYTGSVTELIATDTPAVHKYERSDNEDILSQIMSSTLTISFYSTEFTDFRNFFSFSDTEFFIVYKFSGVEQFRGYLLNDITGEPFQDPPYPVVLTATDGLAQLKEVSLEGPENDIDLFTVIRETLNILNLELNIEVCNDLYEGLVQDNTKSIFAQDANKNLMIQQGTFDDLELNAYEFLDEICKSFGWALYQKNGRWLLQRSIARMIDTTVIYIHSWDTGEVIDSYSVAQSADASLENWISRTTPINNQWSSVVYGNNIWVSVSRNGTANQVMTSPDGITWTLRTTPQDNIWRSVTFGDGLFVAVSANGTNRVMTSSDGINWTLRNHNGNLSWVSVAYGNGLFVAVSDMGVTNSVMTSPDGISWTRRTLTVSNQWSSVIYANNIWVAVSRNGVFNQVITSLDGITWTSRSNPVNYDWRSITFGNGLFVVVGGSISGSPLMTSPDGVTWTNQTGISSILWNSVHLEMVYFLQLVI